MRTQRRSDRREATSPVKPLVGGLRTRKRATARERELICAADVPPAQQAADSPSRKQNRRLKAVHGMLVYGSSKHHDD